MWTRWETKARLPYFAGVGSEEELAWALMPVLGTVVALLVGHGGVARGGEALP